MFFMMGIMAVSCAFGYYNQGSRAQSRGRVYGSGTDGWTVMNSLDFTG